MAGRQALEGGGGSWIFTFGGKSIACSVCVWDLLCIFLAKGKN